MNELEKLNNIGKELAKQLNAVGIYTYDDLVDCGSQEAWLRIKKIDATCLYESFNGFRRCDSKCKMA